MITINLAFIKMIAEWLIAVGGGVAVIVAVVKKVLKPVLQPLKDVAEKQKFIEECLDRDKRRLDMQDDKIADLAQKIERLSNDNELILTCVKAILNHARTDNNTGTIEKLEDDIDQYLIKRK